MGINTMVPAKTGGTAITGTFFLASIITMDAPASRKPMDWTGMNMVFSTWKSQTPRA